MTLLRVVTSPGRVDAIVDALMLVGITGMSVADVRGSTLQQRQRTHYRGDDYEVAFVPRAALQVVVRDHEASEAINEVLEVARVEAEGINRIFVLRVECAYSIDNGEREA